MALDTSGFVPKGNLNASSDALAKQGKAGTVKRVLAFLVNYRAKIILSLILAFVSVLCTLLVPIMIGRAIDGLGSDRPSVYRYLLIAAGFALIVGVSQFLMNIINNSITFNTVKDIRNVVMTRIAKLPLSYIDSHAQGDIVSRVVADAG